MPIDLDATLRLHQASRYQFPQDGSAWLPLSYGTWVDPLVVPADHDDGAFLPAVQIDRTNWVFAINAKPITAGQTIQMYVGDTIQAASVFTLTPSGDYEGLGWPMATVQFLVNPGSNQVGWRGQGTRSSAGALITSFFDVIFDAFSTYGGWTLNDFNLPLCYETSRTLTALGVPIHWVFWKEQTYRDWLNEICKCYHVDYFEDADGKLALKLDRAMLGLSVTVLNTIDAETDLEGTEDDVEYEVDEANVINTLTIKRRLKWTNLTYTDEPTVDHKASVGVYGTLRDTVELPAVYTDAHAKLWVEAYLQRYGFLPAILRFVVRGAGYTTALPGTELGFRWPWMGWDQPRLIKVLNQEPDAFGTRISFEAFDCQRFVGDAVTLPSTDLTSVRRRVREPSTTVDLQPPAAASNLIAVGSFRSVVLRWTPPGDLDYDHTEIWTASVNSRASATFIRNGGYRGTACEETLELDDGETIFVWLMTVDTNKNGANGGIGPTGGNWYPASATAGVIATAVLVPTAAMQPESVTKIYGPDTSATFVGLSGRSQVAHTFLPATEPIGTVDFWANVSLSVPSLCTALVDIREGGLLGQSSGRGIHSNLLTFEHVAFLIVQGAHFNPPFGVFFVITTEVYDQNGVFVSYDLHRAELVIKHTKL